MPRPGFYNDNINRDYPFVHSPVNAGQISRIRELAGTGSSYSSMSSADESASVVERNPLPTFAVADFGSIMGAGSGYVEGIHNVFLSALRKNDASQTLEFEYTSDAPGLVGQSLIFRFNYSDPKYTTKYTSSALSYGPLGTVRCSVRETLARREAELSSSLMSSLSSASSSTSSESSSNIMCRDEPSSESTCHGDLLWEGYMVVGDIEKLISHDVVASCTSETVVHQATGAVDILFLCDTTDSMSGRIDTIQSVFSPLADVLTESLPNFSIRYAVANYRDFTDSGYDSGWKIDSSFTASIAETQQAILTWNASGGTDRPEQNLAALENSAADWITELGGLPVNEADRIVVWAGDAPGHENGYNGQPYPTLQATLDALHAANLRVVAINTGVSGTGIDARGPEDEGTIDGRQQASTIVAHTAGVLHNQVSVTDAVRVAELITASVLQVVVETTTTTCDSFGGPFLVEPSQTQNVDGGYVRMINVANASGVVATAPDECRDFCWPTPVAEHCVLCECLIGDIRIKEGYNACIEQRAAENTIVINGCLGGGAGEPCEAVPTCPDVEPPAGRTHLDGSLGCDEVIRSINGVGGPFFLILGGHGVIVTPVPDKNTIVVDVNLLDMALCPDYQAADSLSDPEVDPDPCACGPK